MHPFTLPAPCTVNWRWLTHISLHQPVIVYPYVLLRDAVKLVT
jgi:hypothetical protein